MQTYFIGKNNYWRTASLILEEVPAGLYYLNSLTTWICDIFPEILLPKLRFRLRSKGDWDWTSNRDGWTTLREWFGDTQALFHLWVCTPMFNFTQKHTKSISINLPYNFLKELFPDEFKLDEDDLNYWCEDDVEHRQRIEETAKWVDGLFRIVYKKLNHDYMSKI
jgi:hypothetical protein